MSPAMLSPPPSPAFENDVRRRALKARLFGIEEPAQKIGRYRVDAIIGEGAMGVVYRGRDQRLDRTVAIKILRPGLLAGSARLEREARALARLSHPNVVTIHEVGDHEGETFIAMEYVRGRSLRDWMAEERSVQERLSVVRQAAEGLLAAHRLGIVHRDFKPDNAIVGDDERVRILDFGLATVPAEAPTDHGEPLTGPAWSRVTRTGACLGTPAYMAPELREGGSPSPASDQYALCCTAWEVLFSRHPFADGATLPETPRKADIPAGVLKAIRRGLEPEPAARHPDLVDVVAALGPSRPARARTWWIAAGVIAIVALGAGKLLSDAPPARSADALDAVVETTAPLVCERHIAFDDSRHLLRDNKARNTELVSAAKPGTRAWVTAQQNIAAASLSLGAWADGCEALNAVITQGQHTQLAACWKRQYCVSEASLPERARCFGGDLDTCRMAAIKHEFEYLDAKNMARDNHGPEVAAAVEIHRAYLRELLDEGCKLGGENLCDQLERMD